MTPREAVQLTGYIQAHFPSQPINEFTPDALGELLADYAMADCKAAVLAISKRGRRGDRTQWCSPSDVSDEVKRIRAKRIADVGDLCPPPGLTDAEERAWVLEERRRIGDGLLPSRETRELKTRHLPDLRALLPKAEPMDDDQAERGDVA